MLEVASVGELALLAQLADALLGMTEHAIQTSVALKGISDTTNVNVKSLQQWNQVARETTGSSEWLASAFVKIDDSISAMNLNQQGPLKALTDAVDLSGLKSVDDLLNRIARSQKLMHLRPGELSNRLRGAGIDPRLQAALRLSEGERNAMRARGPVLSDKELKTFNHIEEEFAKLHAHSEKFKNSVASWTAPELLKTIQAAAEILDELRSFIDADTKRGKTGYIGKTRDVIGTAVTWATGIAPSVGLYNAFNEWRAGMYRPENSRQAALGRTSAEQEMINEAFRRPPGNDQIGRAHV